MKRSGTTLLADANSMRRRCTSSADSCCDAEFRDRSCRNTKPITPALEYHGSGSGLVGDKDGVVISAEMVKSSQGTCAAGFKNHPKIEREDSIEDDVSLTFPQRLMEVLDHKENCDVICWLPHGKGFIINNKKAFEERILPKYFNKQSKYSSFTRKLNRWGFTRVSRGPESGAYFHHHFRRGGHRLCIRMSCNHGGSGSSACINSKGLATSSGNKTPVAIMPPIPTISVSELQQQQPQQLCKSSVLGGSRKFAVAQEKHFDGDNLRGYSIPTRAVYETKSLLDFYEDAAIQRMATDQAALRHEEERRHLVQLQVEMQLQSNLFRHVLEKQKHLTATSNLDVIAKQNFGQSHHPFHMSSRRSGSSILRECPSRHIRADDPTSIQRMALSEIRARGVPIIAQGQSPLVTRPLNPLFLSSQAAYY